MENMWQSIVIVVSMAGAVLVILAALVAVWVAGRVRRVFDAVDRRR